MTYFLEGSIGLIVCMLILIAVAVIAIVHYFGADNQHDVHDAPNQFYARSEEEDGGDL